MLARALELFIVNHTETNTPFYWHHVKFNLPCTTVYITSLPSVQLIHFNGELVVRVIVFFDDGCVYGLGYERVRSGFRQILHTCNLSEIKKLLGSALLEDKDHRIGVDVVCILTRTYRKKY